MTKREDSQFMSSRRTGAAPRRSGEAQPASAPTLRGPLLALGVVVALTVAAVVWMLAGNSSGNGDAEPVAEVSTGEGSAQAPSPLEGLARRQAGDPLARGDVDAPVVMIMWSDFQCPFCGRFARETEPALVDRYVEKGTLRLEWRDFPYLGEQSPLAARAARAAGEQGAFWAYHDALYALELPPNSGQLTQERLTAIAAGLDLDVARFTAVLQSPEVADAVAADFQQGQSLGITGTPAFLVNGTPIMGAQPENVFDDAIEQAAARAGRSSGGG